MQQSTTIKVGGSCLSEKALFSLVFGWGVIMYVWAFIWKAFFSAQEANLWFIVVPVAFPFAIFAGYGLLLLCEVTLTESAIVLSWRGIPLRTIPVDALRLCCAVGNAYENVLCLTSHSVEELALLEEQHILRNYFTKHDLPFIKRKAGWQNVLASKYLNRLRGSLFGPLREQGTLLMKMDPVAVYQIKKMYPQLPYKNYIIKAESQAALFSDGNNQKKGPLLWAYPFRHAVEFQRGEIVLRKKKEITPIISLEQIKTILRVDLFYANVRNMPPHIPALFLSVYSPEEMAVRARKQEKDPLLQAYRYVEKEVKWRSAKREIGCCLYYTPATEDSLRQLCPNAQWIDISDSWLSDRP